MQDLTCRTAPQGMSVSARSGILFGLAMSFIHTAVAFAPHHRSLFSRSGAQLSNQASQCHHNSFSSNFVYNHLGKISHKHVSASPLRQKYTLKPRCAATVAFEPWLSDKDVDVILREEGPGSMRPNPLVPAERYTSKDWLRSLLTTPTAIEFKRVASFLFANTLFATVIWAASLFFPGPVKLLTTAIGPMPHFIVGGVLGLLLVFRTSTAYDRFWEARQLWGFLISRVREVPARPPAIHNYIFIVL